MSPRNVSDKCHNLEVVVKVSTYNNYQFDALFLLKKYKTQEISLL